MRFNHKSLLKTSHVLKRNEFRKILMTNLGLTSIDMDNFFDMDRSKTLDIPLHRVIKNCQICQKYNVNVDSLDGLHYCLYLLDYKLEHRINVFKDIGVPIINMSLLNKTIYYFRMKMSKFEEIVNIPAVQNIAMNIFDGEVPKDISQKLNDKLTIQQYYQMCLLHCKTRVFNLPYLDDKILLDSYMKVKSISMIAETLKVLRLDLHYDDKMIKKHPSVIIASADNIRSLLSTFTDILGIPIVTLLRKYPYILFQDVDNIKQLLMLFKQYEIPDKDIKTCMNVFLISNEVFHERMEMLKRHPDLNMWYKHPRMLQMICHIKKTKCRVQYIDIMDSLKWANPQTFLASKIIMDKAVQTGIVAYQRHLKYVLLKELGVDKSDLLMRHQHWKMVAFIDIAQMLKYLKKHFMINEICPNIHIVLYKQSIVKKMLADLKQQYSQNTKFSFTNSQYLALCLYMLEKDNHFTGDGVWSNKQNVKQQSLEERNTIKKSDGNTNTMEDNNNNLSTQDTDDIDYSNINDKVCSVTLHSVTSYKQLKQKYT